MIRSLSSTTLAPLSVFVIFLNDQVHRRSLFRPQRAVKLFEVLSQLISFLESFALCFELGESLP
jgi:hypothetical protein